MKYKKTDRFVYRNISGEGVFVPVRNGICKLDNLLILNATSTAIWDNFRNDPELDTDTITQWLSEEYEAPPDKMTDDVTLFLGELAKAGCLECST